jgi:hypothetical protein
MTLAALLSVPLPPVDTLRGLWLLIPTDLASTLAAKQTALAAEASAPLRAMVAPVSSPDGAPVVALCADLLTECAPGGLYHLLFLSLDSSTFGMIEVIEINDLYKAGWFLSDEA